MCPHAHSVPDCAARVPVQVVSDRARLGGWLRQWLGIHPRVRESEAWRRGCVVPPKGRPLAGRDMAGFIENGGSGRRPPGSRGVALRNLRLY